MKWTILFLIICAVKFDFNGQIAADDADPIENPTSSVETSTTSTAATSSDSSSSVAPDNVTSSSAPMIDRKSISTATNSTSTATSSTSTATKSTSTATESTSSASKSTSSGAFSTSSAPFRISSTSTGADEILSATNSVSSKSVEFSTSAIRHAIVGRIHPQTSTTNIDTSINENTSTGSSTSSTEQNNPADIIMAVSSANDTVSVNLITNRSSNETDVRLSSGLFGVSDEDNENETASNNRWEKYGVPEINAESKPVPAKPRLFVLTKQEKQKLTATEADVLLQYCMKCAENKDKKKFSLVIDLSKVQAAEECDKKCKNVIQFP